MVYADLKCFYETKQNGLVEFIICLHGDFEHELELPGELLPSNVVDLTDFWEVTDARGVVRFVKMERQELCYTWALVGSKWIDLIASVIHLDPKFVHFDQISDKKFLVNFYTASGEEVDYGFTFGHVSKCLVLGCNDPRLYQPIPSEMMLGWKETRDSKRVEIEIDGVVRNIGVTFHCFLKERKLIGAAFTGDEWESLCVSLDFSATKLLVISAKEDDDLFVGKVMDGFVADPVKMFGCAPQPPGVSSNTVGFVGGTFVCDFIACVQNKQYLNIPTSFHKHKMSVGYREAWVIVGGYSFYMTVRIHGNNSRKGNRNTHVLLVGDWNRLQGVMDLRIGDKMLFQVVSGNIASDDCLYLNVSKLV